MKSSNFLITQNVLAVILGLMLVIWPEAAIVYLIIAIGSIFVISGIGALIRYFRHRGRIGYSYPVVGTGSLLLGLWLAIMPAFFVNILMYVLGIIVIMAGINLLVNLNLSRKWTTVSPYLYAFPLLIIMAGLLVLVNPFAAATIPFIILGSSCIVYGIVNIVNAIKTKKQLDKYEY